MKRRKWAALLATAALTMGLLSGCGSIGKDPDKTTAENPETTKAETVTAAGGGTEKTEQGGYPKQDITAVVPFGNTSGTDGMWRPFLSIAQEKLGVSIVVENQSGASGSVGTQYFMNKPADGYTILTGSESATMFHCMNLIDVDYDDMIPLCLVARDCGVLSTYPGSPYAEMGFQELIDYILAHPGEVTVGTTGVGTMPYVWWALLKQQYGIDVTQVSFDGSGDGNTALMGKHIDLFINGLTTSRPLVEAGSIVPLCVFDKERVEGYDCEAITEAQPEFEKYLPYGSFFVAEVKADTPPEIVEKLKTVFMETYNSKEYQDFLDQKGNIKMGLTGDEANAFMKHQQAVISWLLYDLGESEVEPSSYGVDRPE